MKNKFKLLIIIFILFICAGCDNNITINKDSMDDINIYTSIYPIEYVTEELYGNNAKIKSMYPAGVNPYEYTFTKKQLSNYGKSDLVVYNGLTSERDLIVDMLNDNKELKIIDATARVEYNNDIDEVWINPSSILTIAENVKSGLDEYISSTYLKKDIENNYNNLNLKISKLDANIKDDIENAPYKFIVTTSDNIKVLEKYGLSIYSIDEKSVSDKTYNDVIKLIAGEKIKYIYVTSDTKNNKYLKKIKKAYPNIGILEIDMLNNLSEKNKRDEKDYISIMDENRDKLKKELYK